MATASRDRLVHIFDIDHDYGLVQTLDDHSSAITAVRFTELDSQLMMLSCGADKSLLFRNAQLVCYAFIVLSCMLYDDISSYLSCFYEISIKCSLCLSAGCMLFVHIVSITVHILVSRYAKLH